MKTLRILSVVSVSLFSCAVLHAQTESLTVPLSDPGKPYHLNVGLVNGGITITGYEGKDIVIKAIPGGRKKQKDGISVNTNVNISGKKDKEGAAGMRKLVSANSAMDVSAEEKNNRVVIHSDSWKRAVDLAIKVPASGGVFKVSATNDGDIVISNVNGELEVNNINGAISLSNISGSVVANTINGSLVCVFRSVDGKSPMAFSTLNGKVDVTFPALVKANIKAKSDMGEVYSDFDVDMDKAPAKVNRVSEKGMYKLNIDDWILGKINGGGPEMMMKTMNGNIYIRKAK